MDSGRRRLHRHFPPKRKCPGKTRTRRCKSLHHWTREDDIHGASDVSTEVAHGLTRKLARPADPSPPQSLETSRPDGPTGRRHGGNRANRLAASQDRQGRKLAAFVKTTQLALNRFQPINLFL